MKKLFFLLIIISMGCSQNSENLLTENTIIGRWHLVGFEQTVMYEFTNDLRYTIYSTDSNFGSLETAIPNPNSWLYEQNELVIDLNFGNFFRAVPNFKCNGNVVDLVSDSGTTTLFREGYEFDNCNE